MTYCSDVKSTVCQQRSECKMLDSEETLKRSHEYDNLMCFTVLSHFSCFIMVNTLFLLFSFITVESAFKMVAM